MALASERHSPRINGFDGLRAVAVGGVLLTHLHYGAIFGSLGVRLFFALSGFLITSLLIRELERTGTVNLGRFVVRRALRIFPAYYAALAFVAIITGLSWIRLFPAVTYTYNFVPPGDRISVLSHLWTLAIEEHFYLVWPAVVLLAGRARSLRVICIALVATCVLAAFGGVPGSWTIPAAMPIALGALGALSLDRLRGAAARGSWLVCSLTLLLSPIVIAQPTELPSAVGAIGLVIWIAINQGTVRVLDWGPIGYLGRISYGVYIWQGIFTGNGATPEFGAFPPSQPILQVALTLVFAIASWHLLEQPLLRLRDRRRPLLGARDPDKSGHVVARPSSTGVDRSSASVHMRPNGVGVAGVGRGEPT